MKQVKVALLGALIGVGLQALAAGSAWAESFVQTNLVSDIPGLAAITDPKLKNPWGVSRSDVSPFWVSDQGTNFATLYNVTATGVTKNPLEVAIPTTTGAGPQGPTGQVFNTTTGFLLKDGTPARFIFANLNGTISAWNPASGTAAQLEVTTPASVYSGLALATSGGNPFLYAVNAAQGRIDVFDGSFNNVTASTFAGKFVDPNLPKGLAPFNVQNIDGKLYVTYAPPGRPAQIAATRGEGAVAVFDANGNFIKQLVSGSQLASPWGITLAPAGFGKFGGDLLVGNFSFVASEINAFDPVTGAFVGSIPIDTGSNSPGGLWALIFGNAGNNGDPNTLFFSDGINGEVNGLFASISVSVPEPGTWTLLGIGVVSVFGLRRRARRTLAGRG